MRKKRILFALAAAVCILFPCYAYASSESTSGRASVGNITYRDGSGVLTLYGEDIALLEGKIASIEVCQYDPAVYSHTHQWKYIDLNGQTHTRHCDLCGAAYDTINAHTVDMKEPCTISQGEAVYDGYRYRCECGHQWEKEVSHNLIYVFVDENVHTVSCALNGAAYCNGMTEHVEKHEFDITPDSDYSGYHIRICSLCGYSKSEPCHYTNGPEGEDENTLQCCICGKTITDDESDNPGESEEQENEGQKDEEQRSEEQDSEKPETDSSDSEDYQDENSESGDSDDGDQKDENSGDDDSGDEDQEDENPEIDVLRMGVWELICITGNLKISN